MKIDIQTTTTQQMTSAQADAFVKAHLGLRQTLSEPASVNTNPPFPLEDGHHLPTAIQMTDGIYTDTRSKLLSAGVTTIQGTEYQRILDEEVLRVLLANKTHTASDKFTKEEFAAITAIGELFRSKSIQSVEDFDCSGVTSLSASAFDQCTTLTKAIMRKVSTIGNCVFGGCTSLKYIFMPKLTNVPWMFYYGSGSYSKVCPDNLSLFTPNVNSIVSGCHWSAKIAVHDIGNKLSAVPSDSFGSGASYVNNLVLRYNGVVSHCPLSNYTALKKVYVPISQLGLYKSAGTDSWGKYQRYLDIIFAIGGSDWCSTFGIEHKAEYDTMTYEQLPNEVKYADVKMYAPDDYDEIVAAYEE